MNYKCMKSGKILLIRNPLFIIRCLVDDVKIARVHSHGAGELKQAGFLWRKLHYIQPRLKCFSYAQARDHEITKAGVGIGGIDDPLNRHAFFDREPIGDVSLAALLHLHYLSSVFHPDISHFILTRHAPQF